MQREKLRWQLIRNDGTLSSWVWPNRVVTGSDDGEMAALQQWLTQRTAWLDDALKP
ncbi:hypothetical protein [Gemmatimonas phototrophica]|uniref:hypothetical protein n=1 Tax=Gemmatimonas phototrophica TaxID=1379270 RepID=UPI000A49007A|nr:hypothetical protein [Gemmatimonas phototrophica]